MYINDVGTRARRVHYKGFMDKFTLCSRVITPKFIVTTVRSKVTCLVCKSCFSVKRNEIKSIRCKFYL